jgi:hypothetical protein
MKRIIELSLTLIVVFFIFIIAGCMANNNKTADKTKSSNNVLVPRYPFPHYTEYAITPMPPDKTKKETEEIIIDLFRNILLNDLIVDSTAPQNSDEFRMVIRHSHEWEVNEGTIEVSHINVSESQGYGMIIIAYMAGCEDKLNFLDNNWIFGSTSLKDYYDAMLRTVMAFPSVIAPHLFTWELFGYPAGENTNGTGYKTINGIKTAPFTPDSNRGDCATDGDMDIIYSLILADRQWGSGGKYNYINIAKNMLNDLWDYCVHDEYHTLLLGDWAKNHDAEIFANASRPSDFIISHLKTYKEVNPDHDWQAVIDATYNIIKEIRNKQNAAGNNNGLMPDFVIRVESGWEIPGESFIEDYDGDFSYNACRVPWRFGTDYFLFGNTAIGNSSLYDLIIKPLDDFARNYTGGNPDKLGPLFMDGKPFSWTDPDLFAPPFLVTAAAVTNQEWVNTLWNFNGLSEYNGDTYGDYIKLLVMLTVTGAYWLP